MDIEVYCTLYDHNLSTYIGFMGGQGNFLKLCHVAILYIKLINVQVVL